MSVCAKKNLVGYSCVAMSPFTSDSHKRKSHTTDESVIFYSLFHLVVTWGKVVFSHTIAFWLPEIKQGFTLLVHLQKKLAW